MTRCCRWKHLKCGCCLLRSLVPPGRGSTWKSQLSQSDPTLHWGEAHELGWMGSTRSFERVTIASSKGYKTRRERREITLFSSPSLCQPLSGAMGPSMVAFLKGVYGRAKVVEKFLKLQQPALRHTWNTLVALSFWDVRLSIACAATDVEYPSSRSTVYAALHICLCFSP